VSKKQEVKINPLPNRHLPDGWVLGEVQDLVKIRNGYAFKSEDFNVEKGVPVIRQTNLSTDTVNFDKPKFLPEDFLENHSGYKIEKGDVLIGLSGSIGSLSTYREDFPALQNQRTGLLVENVEGSKKYVEYFLLSIKRQLNEVAKGVAVQNISSKQIERWPIPIAPLEQQKRIVAEIEKQFSRLDEAVTNLKRVKANLKRYKAAVLKAAVEGKLTEEWRKQHPDVEPASKLLERILSERRQKWEEAELAKMKAKGKAPKDDKWKKKYKEPATPDTKGLSELPEGWIWATIEQLTSELINGYGKRSQTAGKPRIVLRLADITDGEISYEDVRRINCTDDETFKYALNAKDFLILRVNGSPELVGRFVIVRKHIKEVLFCDHFIRVRCVVSDLAVWLRAYGDSKRFRRFIDLNKVSSAGQNTISQGVLLPFPVPLPSEEEQENIIVEIERRLSITDEIEAQLCTNIQRAEKLRQSVLKNAFSGRLMT